ncbi:hypothetical protein HOR51_gp35 [Ralstonia phage phiAp1]|uniref:Uncharacterized protein n=1 Tax=Ralstonia phage phiAp1 TaxID=2783867 RepID=A0A1L7DS72_9CAUD|nr:hypothetical protein HOR51_gp35 [Ralstonia phage phiAp1]APU03176.1 hypothetical protein phiAp1_35 [Ralstonia phage phiAp1]
MTELIPVPGDATYATREVKFTPQQLADLERCFPECVDVGATDAKLRATVGQRQVINYIRSKVAK